MTFSLSAAPRTHAQAGIKLALLLERSESEFANRVRALESDALFKKLLAVRVISIQPFANARFAVRRFGGWGLRTASDGVPSLDGRGDLANLIQRVGQERFEKCFLGDEARTDEERARICGISEGDAARIREMVDGLYVQEECNGPASTAAPSKSYSAVAGVSLEGGKPVIAFFNRDIWKGRYQVNDDNRRTLLAGMPVADARRIDGFLRELELLDRRKTTLYRAIEFLIEAQAEYFVTGDPEKRVPLTQRELAGTLGSSPSVLCRLISTKSIQLPWGLEAPLRALMPSRKSIMRDRLYNLLRSCPDASDTTLGELIERTFGVHLSRRSVAQYRADLGVDECWTRRRVHQRAYSNAAVAY